MPTFDQIRQSYPDAAKASDEEIILRWAQLTGTDVTTAASDFGVQHTPQRNPLGAGLSAGVDQLQGLGYGAIGAGARALGAEGVADWADRGVTRNYAESAFNGRSDLERVEVQSLGSALPFLGYQVAKQVPMLAGTLAASAAVPQAAIPAALSRGLAVIPKGLGGGGLKAGMDFAGRRAALEAGNAFGRTIAASYPIGVGAMYGEAVERGDPSQGDALAALGLGVPYGAAEAVMPSMVRNAFGSNAARFAGGLPTRLIKAGGLGFKGEAGTELFQNELEMGFAGDLTQDEIDSRRLNSAVIGGLVGGTFNLPAGFRGHRNPADPIDLLNRDTTPQASTAPAAGLNLTNLAVPQQGIFSEPSQVEQWAGIAPAPTAEQHASRAEDILAAFNTPVGEVGGRPVTAWEAFQREQGVPANRIQTGPAQIKDAAPKINIPVPQPLQNDPVRSAVAQASPATLRKDGSLKDIVEKALGAYSEFSDGEIAAALEEFASSKRKDTVWRVAALEAIARQRAAQGAPNVAQVDAASGQGAGAVPAGSAGNTPSGPVVLDGVRQPAGAPAPSSAARVPVGDPVVQQPASVEDVINAVSPVEQVAPQAQEARGQEGAQDGAEPSRDAERAQVSRIFDSLSEREREVLTKYHFDKMTFEDIGAELKERGESGTTRQRIEQQHKEALKKLAEAGRPFGLTPERLRLYFPDESRRTAGGADVQTASAAEVAQAGAGMTYRNESNNGAVNQANDEFEMADAVDGAEALDLDTDIAREEFDEGFRGERGADADVLEEVDAVESMARTERDHAGREITEDAIRIAGLEYDQDLQEGDVPFAQLDRADQIRYTKAAIAFNDEVLSAQQLMRIFGEIADGTRQQASQPQRAVEEAGAVAQVQGAVPTRDAREARQETDTREEVTSTPTARDVGRTAAREYAAGALTRLQQYYDSPNLAALASRLENAGNTASLDSELDTDQEWERDFNLSNSLEKVRRDAAAIERLAAAHPEAFELGYLRAQDYGGFASDTPVSELISHMSIASVRPSAEFGSPRDYYVQRDAQASEGVNQIDSRTLGVGDGNRFSRTSNTQGTTVEAVRSAINAIATPMGRRKITVYQTADEAVQSGALNSKDAKGTQGWVDDKGNAFFIAGNIPKGSELAVVLHEIGAHLGIEKLLTDAQYEALVKKIFAWAQSDANTQEAKIARAALARVDAAKLENEADLAPETIAYFIEEAVKAGVNPTAMQYKTELGRWFRTLWAAFKVALRRLNLINADRLTAQNVVDLAYGAARIELASTYHGTAANFRRFDHRYMGSGEGAQRFGIANEYFEADVGRKSGGPARWVFKDANGNEITPTWNGPTGAAYDALRKANGDYATARASQTGFGSASVLERLSDLEKKGVSVERVDPTVPEGNIHITDINATEDELLDWDKPISKQSPQVREALEAVFDNYDIGIAGYDNLDMTGEQMYNRLSGSRGLGSDKAASEYLDSLGIKGIKFLDATSRDPLTVEGAEQAVARAERNVESAQAEFDRAATTHREGSFVLNGLKTKLDAAKLRLNKARKDLSAAREFAPTRNLVVFNDRNIYRVGSMRGGPVGKGGRMMFSKAADPQLVELAQKSGQRALKAIQAGIRKGWTGLAFSSHLTDAAVRAGLTSARALKLVQDKKQTAAYEIQIEVEKVLSKFASLEGKIGNDDVGTVVQRFIYDSTFDQKWGFAPDWKDDATVDPGMESRFKAIERVNPQAAEVIKDVFRHGDAIFRKKQDLLRKTITGEYEALIKAETDDGKRRKLERRRDKELREAGKLLTALRGPYSPLRSYGDYVVIAKSQKFRDAEAAGPVDPELKRDRRHYVVDFARTLYEAEKLQADLEADFGKGLVWAGEKETATEQFGELPFMAVQRLRKMVDTDLEGDLNTKSKRVLNKLLVDLYISTLHEANARHSEQKRQFVNRASRDRAAQDMMRAFATQGRADSHLVSALQFNSEIVDKMQAMRDQAKRGGGSMLKTRLRNEILQRHMMDLDFRETPVQDKLMSLNSFWMLLTSPGYYVQNAFQVMMMTQPVLAGRFGQGRSMRQLMRGYQDAMRVLKGSSWNEAADLSRFNGTDDEKAKLEKAMLVELQARGLLDFGISAELGYWEASGEISKVFNQTMRKVGMATRKLEVMNRMTSALAAYRMMYERSSGTQTERHAAAVEYADSIINDTHGNYGTSNAPRYLRMLPKPMTQFRKFQLFQLSLFVKVIHGSVKGASPQEKRVMLATLGYLFMNHALLAGAVGVPASALLGAIYAIAGDDDDPNDWEVDVRRAIGDKEMADLILHGLPSLININMSNKIGAGTMLDPLPFVEYEATRGGYEKVVTAAMGPLVGGLGAQVVDAFGRILKGDVAQGTAQLLPRGFRDAARGFMAAQDGIQLRNGQTALTPEELSFYDSLMMGLGLPTLKTTSRTETQFKSQQYEQFFKTRVTKIKRQYSEAYEDNDREAMLEARQAWAEMQASRKNLGFKVQPLSDLLKAPREKAKAEAKLENGIRTTEQARGFVQSLQ